MAQTTVTRSFAGGEISPALNARADQQKYATGLKTCRNMQVMKHGGVQNRAGLEYVARVKFEGSGRTVNFLRYTTATQVYLIEAGFGYFRFFKNGEPILVDEDDITAWLDATPYEVGDFVVVDDVNYVCIDDHTSDAANDEPGAGTNEADYWHALTGLIYELPTPYSALGSMGAGSPPLQYAQDGDVLTIARIPYAPYELVRISDTEWTLSLINGGEGGGGGPTVPAPSGLGGSGTGSGVNFDYYVVAIDTVTGEQSFRSAVVTINAATAVISLGWTMPEPVTPGRYRFDVYRNSSANQLGYGKVGANVDPYLSVPNIYSWGDNAYTPDYSTGGPVDRALFGSSGENPSAVEHYQQRRIFAGSTEQPQTAWASRVGSPANFSISDPIQDADSVSFTLSGRNAQIIRHLINLKRLIILTDSGEWVVKGDGSGTLTPSAINADQEEHIGSSDVRPAVIGNTVLYGQARGTSVRDLAFNFEADGYTGKDLSIFASHLFDGYTILAMDYARLPHSILWVVRSDGVLLGLTYLREHDIWAWHRHDTEGGRIGDVCVIPEGAEDAVYVHVNRGVAPTFSPAMETIERLHSRLLRPVVHDYLRARQFFEDSFFVDSGVTRNAWDLATNGLTLASPFGGGWTVDDRIRIATDDPVFTTDNVGDAVDIDQRGLPGFDDSEPVRFTIVEYEADDSVLAVPDKTVPVDLRSGTVDQWALAVRVIDGLDHLEDFEVAVFGDGDSVGTFTVSGGEIELPRPYAIVHAGIPIVAEIETLDLDIEGSTVRDRRKSINGVTLMLQDTRGIEVGPDADNLNAADPDKYQTDYVEETGLTTGDLEVRVVATKKSGARVIVRQNEPLPVTILGLMPSVEVGG